MRSRYHEFINKVQIYLIVFACFSIALSTAFMSVAMSLLVLIWMISGNYDQKFELIKTHPASIISIALFGLYGVGVLYSTVSWETSLSWWMKYHKLLYIPLIISVLTQEKYRKLAVNSFLAGMLMVLFVSYLKWLNVVSHEDIGQGYFVFKGRIAHNIFMAFALYIMLHLAVKLSGWKRWILIGICLLAVINILFMVNGRTGQIIMFFLLVWFCWEIWRKKSIQWLAIISVVTVSVYFMSNDFPKSRLLEIDKEIMNHDSSKAPTPAGLRLEFYINSVILIKQNPIFGGGTGSFEHEYRLLAENQDTATKYVPNPHNEFLLIGQELGAVGLLLLMAFFIIPWRLSYEIEENKENRIYSGYALRGLIITIVIGSLFNSLLLDAGEGKFYCVLAGVLLSAYKPMKMQYR